jgi:hypothetical protein
MFRGEADLEVSTPERFIDDAFPAGDGDMAAVLVDDEPRASA